MSDSKSTYSVHFVPWGVGTIEEDVTAGVQWLHQQSGIGALFVPAVSNYRGNRLLPKLAPHAAVLTERDPYRQRWAGGPMLVCWPTDGMLNMLSDTFADRVTAVCVLEWGHQRYQRAWIAAREGIDILTGQSAHVPEPDLHPVVQHAMEQMAVLVNHANGLNGVYDKPIAIQILQALVKGGYDLDVELLCAWASVNGFTGTEVDNLRDYADKARRGHRFRLPHRYVLRSDILRQWEVAVQAK